MGEKQEEDEPTSEGEMQEGEEDDKAYSIVESETETETTETEGEDGDDPSRLEQMTVTVIICKNTSSFFDMKGNNM